MNVEISSESLSRIRQVYREYRAKLLEAHQQEGADSSLYRELLDCKTRTNDLQDRLTTLDAIRLGERLARGDDEPFYNDDDFETAKRLARGCKIEELSGDNRQRVDGLLMAASRFYTLVEASEFLTSENAV
jgi:hypothetical protein